MAPETTFPSKTEQVITGCPHAPTTDRETSTLVVKTWARDPYGNVTVDSSHNGSGQRISIFTAYDDFYHLFPVERWNEQTPTVVATASYYGVESVAIDSGRGGLGAMSESCAINEICVRFGYDQFGRRIRQWDRQVAGSSWPSDASANVLWSYRDPGELGVEQTTYIVSEWHAPRCEGNWVRHHYDGLGQLVVEQKSYQDWKFSIDGCSVTAGGSEINTRFRYDGSGHQIEATIPRLYDSTSLSYSYYAPPSDWSIKSQTLYDPIGRVTRTIAPNGEQVDTYYNGRIATTIGAGRNGDENKMLRWNQVDALGYLSAVRAMYWDDTESEWLQHAEVALTNNVVGNVVEAVHSGINITGTYEVGSNTYSYDQAGRMTAMVDMDMGTWEYQYNRHGLLTRQKDGCGRYTCLAYDTYARLCAKHFNGTSSSCPGTLTHESYAYGTTGTALGQLTQISLTETLSPTVYYQKSLAYNSSGQLQSETVSYPSLSQQFAMTYGYDAAGRPTTTDYPTNYTPTNEQVTYSYNGMGATAAVVSNLQGAIVDGIGYDELGRVTALRYAVGDDLYLHQDYYPWIGSGSSSDSNARLQAIEVGTSGVPTSTLALRYNYDSFSNITAIGESYNNATLATRTFDYDTYNRLHHSYDVSAALEKLYQTKVDGRPSTYEGQVNHYDNTQPYAIDAVTAGANQLAYTRDANVTVREVMSASVKITQTLTWDEANRLQSVSVGGTTIERYWYNEQGIRVRKEAGGVTTLYPFAGYEVEGSTATRYYLLNGQAIAYRTGTGAVTYLHHDQVGSVVMTTANGVLTQQRQYFGYGNKRGGDELAVEFDYTGQRRDGTGLLYYNARYYDPSLGMFISPDSLIPDPSDYFSHNRYLYSKGNPLKYNDPTGHQANIPGWHPGEEYSEWESYSGIYSGCFKCHASTLNGGGPLTNEQLDAVAQQMLEDPALALEAALRVFEPADYVLTTIDCFDTCDPNVLYWTMAPGLPGSTGKIIAWSNRNVKTAADDLLEGATSIYVPSRSDAEELFLGLYQGAGYRNSDGFRPEQAKLFFDGKGLTYHWDDLVQDGKLMFHQEGSADAMYRHLQIHTEEGPIIRIFFGEPLITSK